MERIEITRKMLKKLLIVSAISSSAFISPVAMADTSDSGFYLTAGIGTGLEHDIDGSIEGTDFSAKGRTTFAGGIGLGYELDSNLRVEAGLIRSTANVDSVTVEGIKYDVDDNGTGTVLSVAVAYDFENDSRITPFVAGSYGIIWEEDADDSSNSFGLDVGLSTPVSDDVELWGAIGLGISQDETNDIDGSSVKTDGTTAWGFSTGLRIRL